MSATATMKRPHDHIEGEGQQSADKKQKTKEGDALEFTVLQKYRQLEDDLIKDRAQTIRTGDIGIVVKNLKNIDHLFESVKGSKNNGIFAHDAKTIVNLSELAQISVRNLKIGETRSLIGVDEVLAYSKRYMLKEYFKINKIKEEKPNINGISNVIQEENEHAEEAHDELADAADNKRSENLRQNEVKKMFLQQFDNYNEFDQFNWFRMGALFDNLSKSAPTVDHLCGPFSLEKKIRAPIVRRINTDKVGEKTTAEKVTKETLDSKEPTTCLLYTSRCV